MTTGNGTLAETMVVLLTGEGAPIGLQAVASPLHRVGGRRDFARGLRLVSPLAAKEIALFRRTPRPPASHGVGHAGARASDPATSSPHAAHVC
jgi:hypothetical protein